MNNTCDQVRIPGTDCVADDDCGENEVCSSCMCVPDPPVTQFSDEEFALTDGADETTTGTFSLQGITMGNNVQLDFPDQNGTIALLSDLPDDDFPDDTFRVSSSINQTNNLAFDLSGVTGTQTVEIPDASGLMILGEAQISGSAAYSVAPIAGPPLGWILERHQGMVTLSVEQIVGRAVSNNIFRTIEFIPVNMRPPAVKQFFVIAINNGNNVVGRFDVTTTGTIEIFSSLGGGLFSSTRAAGIRATAFTWLTQN